MIAPPPLSVIFPPDTALEDVTEVTAAVVSVARRTVLVVNAISLP